MSASKASLRALPPATPSVAAAITRRTGGASTSRPTAPMAPTSVPRPAMAALAGRTSLRYADARPTRPRRRVAGLSGWVPRAHRVGEIPPEAGLEVGDLGVDALVEVLDDALARRHGPESLVQLGKVPHGD